MTTIEQRIRDALERMEVPNAQSYTAGDLVELANMVAGISPSAPTMYIHRKSDGVYRVIDTALVQTDKPLKDMDRVMVYKGVDGRMWVRELDEFLERFDARTLTHSPATRNATLDSPQSGSAGEAVSDDFGKYVALAERCGAEVGRHEGQMVWMKFHRQSSVEAFVTGIAMLAALPRQAPAAPAEADPAGDNPWHDPTPAEPVQQDTKGPRLILWDSAHPDYPVEWTNPGRAAREGEIAYIRYDIFSAAVNATSPAEEQAAPSGGQPWLTGSCA